MSKRYQYVKISGQYYCLQQNPVVLAWFLYSKYKSLHLRYSFGKKKVAWTIKAFIQHQLHLRQNGTILELPVYGNLCLKVHRGYKIFNYGQNSVIRIINPDVDSAVVMNEIKGVQSASQLNFAPNILHWNIEEQWYEEEFVNGYPVYSTPKSESTLFFKIYYQDIAPCLEQMILLQPPLATNLAEYVNKTIGVLTDKRLSSPELDVRKVNSIRCFVESMTEQLRLEEICQVDLVFSHGDFSLVNILRTKEGIMVIDWESGGGRSVLFDLYNYFFTELYYKRATTSLVSQINEAISSLQSSLMTKAPGLARSLISLAQVYRRLYYLERVRVLLERELSDKVLDVVLRSIEVFKRYEEVVVSHKS